jgi:hypothetical protein
MRKSIVFFSLLLSLGSYAQLGGLLNKAKDKIAKAKSIGTPDISTSKTGSTGGIIDKTVSAAKPDEVTDGISGPIHQKYMNKIVFAHTDADLAKGKENESGFLTKATFGEAVIYRVYLDNSLCNYLKAQSAPEVHGRYKIKFYIDDVEAGTGILSENIFEFDEKRKWTTFRGALKSPDGSDYIGLRQFNNFVRDAESKFTPGDHKFRMELLPYQDYPQIYEGPAVASGEITLTVKNALFDINDPKSCLPKAMMADKNLEAKVLGAFKAKGWPEQPKEVRITSEKWNIVRNKITGVITRRYIDAAVGSTKEGKCSYQIFSFYQDYDGSGYQSEMYLEGVGISRDVSCKCMKP